MSGIPRPTDHSKMPLTFTSFRVILKIRSDNSRTDEDRSRLKRGTSGIGGAEDAVKLVSQLGCIDR